MNDHSYLKEKYKATERNILMLILLPLPFFALVYLNMTNPVRTVNLPEIPEFFNPFLVSLGLALLMFQHINFRRNTQNLKETDVPLERKILGYLKASSVRYQILALVGFIAAFGLLFFGNVGFTILYAIVAILVSVLKPSPSRIIRLFRLKEEEKEFVHHINKHYIE